MSILSKKNLAIVAKVLHPLPSGKATVTKEVDAYKPQELFK